MKLSVCVEKNNAAPSSSFCVLLINRRETILRWMAYKFKGRNRKRTTQIDSIVEVNRKKNMGGRCGHIRHLLLPTTIQRVRHRNACMKSSIDENVCYMRTKSTILRRLSSYTMCEDESKEFSFLLFVQVVLWMINAFHRRQNI